jgi:hypothetical protein
MSLRLVRHPREVPKMPAFGSAFCFGIDRRRFLKRVQFAPEGDFLAAGVWGIGDPEEVCPTDRVVVTRQDSLRHFPTRTMRRRFSQSSVGRLQLAQSTATSSAAHTWSIRAPLSRPRRSTSTATETLSTESRFIAHRRGTGSSSGSSTTSLRRPRIVDVHGAMRARRSLGMATSRDRTTTGRRPISGNSHHHTSPRNGRAVTRQRRSHETMPNHPTRRVRRVDVAHRRCRRNRSQWLYAVPPAPGALRPRARRR